MDKLAKRIGRRISEVRKKKGMTAEKLAYENDLSKGYLSDIENGNRIPSIRLLDKIARALDTDIKDLF